MKSNRSFERLSDIARGTTAALMIVLVVVGVPVGLAISVGWPLPHHMPTLGGIRLALDAHGISDQTLLDALACVAWLVWACVVVSIAEEVMATTRGRGSKKLPIAGAFQPMSARLVAAVLFALFAVARTDPPMMSSLSAPLAQQLHPNAARLTASVEPSTPIPATTVPDQSPSIQSATPTSEIPSRTYTVVPNDNLWSIAQSQFGDGADWPAIAALNLGRTMSDGRLFVDPNLIYPGWILLMPGNDPVVTQPTDAPAPSPPPPAASSSQITLVPPSVLSTPNKDRPSGSRPVGPTRRTERPVPRHPHTETVRPISSSLPELVALGIGAIGCAALARRSRRIRLLRRVAHQESRSAFEHSELAVDTDTLISRFAGVPALRVFESANCRLGYALSGQGRLSPAPRFRAISVGASGIDFWLHVSSRSAPSGFTLSEDGKAWHIGHETIEWTETNGPYLPIALPIGEDETGTWLVPLQPGNCLPLVGEAAKDLWRAARTVQEGWSWAEQVLVTDDPAVVQSEVQLLSNDGTPSPYDQQILFFGDPQLLPVEQRQRVSTVTTGSARASDVTVLVDRHGATIHPLGRTVRPHLMSPSIARGVDEFVSTPIALDDAFSSASEPITRTIGTRPYLREPGTVEVKLMTMTPRLEGLRDALPPNRARRATELVAYLALHRPDVVTSDRLRTRVLGSSDADAASKTLFNIASAARRAMGTDTDGTPLFPSGSRTGHYRLSESVTTDVERAADLATLGSSAQDPDEAMALLRAALDLIESEPMANALSGYTWWEAEGHGARIAAVAVNAACNLAALAVSAQLFDLAYWGLAQARLVDPYSEAISRSAMQVAAAAGDADQFRREWRECQRRIDELDPGGSPSPHTERLYGELSQQLFAHVSPGRED